MENSSTQGNMVFMYPGVGSQYFRMGEEIYKNHPVVKTTFEEANDALHIDFHQLCHGENDGKLDRLEYAKPALVCLSVAIFRLYMQEVGIEPKYCMGYSLGEYSALCCAGVLKLGDALNIVHQRALIVSEVAAKINGTMAWVVNTPKQVVVELWKAVHDGGRAIYISSYDSNEKLSVSGTIEEIRRLATKIEDAGGMVIPIKMSGPFHSPLMKEASARLREILEAYPFSKARYAVLANRNAAVYTDHRDAIIENLALQLCEPILWDLALQWVIGAGVTTAIELGPKNVLKYLTETNTNKVKAYSIEKTADIHHLIQGITVSAHDYLEIIKRSLGVAVSTKNHCAAPELYDTLVVKPYQRIQHIYEKCAGDNGNCSLQEVREVLDLVRQILQTKGSQETEITAKIGKLLQHRYLLSGC